MFFVGTFGLNFQLTSALMATEVYGKGAGEYGVIGSIMALGSITGALLSARRADAPAAAVVVVAALVFGSMEIVIALMPTLPDVRAAHPAHRDHRADHDHVGEHRHAADRARRAPRPGDGALPHGLHGRHAARLAAASAGSARRSAPAGALIGGGLVSILGTLLCVVLYLRARRPPRGVGRAARPMLRRCLDSSGEPPLPAPGHPGRPGPADRDRRDQLGDPWLSRWPSALGAGPGGASSTTSGSCARSRRAGSAEPTPRWRRVELRYVDLKAGRHLQVTSYDATQAFTANHRRRGRRPGASTSCSPSRSATGTCTPPTEHLQLRVTKKRRGDGARGALRPAPSAEAGAARPTTGRKAAAAGRGRPGAARARDLRRSRAG